MPNTKSAKKALRSSLRKQSFNRVTRNKVKNSLKEFRRTLAQEAGNSAAALSKVFASFDKAVKTNYMHKNTANRRKSRLAKLLSRSEAK